MPTKVPSRKKCGHGIYFSICSTYAAQYCVPVATDELLSHPHYIYLLVYAIACGQSFETVTVDYDRETCPPGCQSVKGLGRKVQNPSEDITDSHGLIWQTGTNWTYPDDRKNSRFLIDEYCMFDQERCKPLGFAECCYIKPKKFQ